MSVLRPKPRPGGGGALSALLRAERFRLGRDAARVAHNLSVHGGLADDGAAAWIGADLPPHGAPSVTLGAARGTLGPHSFGFLDNTRERGSAPFAAPLAVRPRRGPIAMVCGRRDDLPDVAPLAVARDLGVSWIISVGEGPIDEVLAFLAADPTTRAVMLAASSGARAGSLAALDGKPAVVLGGDPLLRASARRGGGADASDLEAWFAHGALHEAGAAAKASRPVALIIGGGARLVADAARAVPLELPLHSVGDDDPEEVEQAMVHAASESDLLLAVGSGPVPRPAALASTPIVTVDIGHLERLKALLAALSAAPAPAPSPPPRVRAEREQVRAVLDAAGDDLSDHDTKRLLKAYGVRVSRQAPASSPTAAARIAAQVGYPVDVVAGRAPGAASRSPLPLPTRRAPSAPEVRRAAAVLLDEAPFVLVREAFPESPRARLAIRREPDLGAYAAIAPLAAAARREERALLPLDPADALLFARAAQADDEKAAIEILGCVAAAAVECALTLELELFLGDRPAVVAAAARRARTR